MHYYININKIIITTPRWNYWVSKSLPIHYIYNLSGWIQANGMKGGGITRSPQRRWCWRRRVCGTRKFWVTTVEVVGGVPHHEWHHVFKQPLWAQILLGHVLWRVQQRGWCQAHRSTGLGFVDYEVLGLGLGLGLDLWRGKLGLLDWWVGLGLLWLAHQEAWVCKVEVEPFICDDKSLRVLIGSFNLLLRTAPWIGASIVTPVCSMELNLVIIN